MSSPGTTGLVSYHNLNETSGTRVDSHTGGYDLTDNGTVTSLTGVQGNGASFDPAGTEYLDSATTYGAAVGSSVTSFSVSFWFKTDVTGSNDGMFYIGNFSGSHGEFNVHNGSGNNLVTSIDGASTTWSFTHSDTASWHHYAFAYNGSSVTIWYDNVKQHTASAYSTTLNFSGLKLVLGGYFDNRFLHDGGLDEVSVYTGKAFSDAEVTWLYNSGSGRTYSDLTASANEVKSILGISNV